MLNEITEVVENQVYDHKNLINKINSLSQLVNTIFVDSSYGKITTVRTVKDKNIIRNIEDSIDYSLKRHRIITKSINSKLVTISDLPQRKTVCSDKTVCNCLSYDILELFISELNDSCKINKQEFNFFKQNFFLNIFFKKNPEDLVNKILSLSEKSSWIIVSKNILETLEKSKRFQSIKTNNDSIIKCLGTIDNLKIYLNPSEKESLVYFGNYDSITILINKNIEQKLNEFSHTKNGIVYIDYLFVETGEIQALLVT